MRKLKNLQLAILLSSSIVSSAFAAERVNNITINGNLRVESDTVKSYLGVHKGEEFSSAKYSQAIKNLYDSKQFESIDVKFVGGNLIVNVKEFPFIYKVAIEGSSKVPHKDIIRELETRSGHTLMPEAVKSDILKIKAMYKQLGRYNVEVTPKIKNAENNRVKITFDIKEGPKTAVSSIKFIGNKNYTDRELKSIITTKEKAFFRFLSSDDVYDPNKLEQDQYLLKRFYNSLGFKDFRVVSTSAELNKTKESFMISFVVEEGQVYYFRNTNIINGLSEEVNTTELEKLITVKTGDKYNGAKIEAIAESMTNYLRNKGYANAVVSPEIKDDFKSQEVNVTFKVIKTSKTYVNKINISGNEKTKDYVIRRKIKLQEGEAFSHTILQRSVHKNLAELNYFEKQDYEVRDTGNDDKVDIDVTVQEKSTASIGMQLGYNTQSGFMASADFNERNLFGEGKELDLSVSGNKKNHTYRIGLTEPYFMGREVETGISAFNTQSRNIDEQPYNLRTYGMGLSAKYNINENWIHDIDYSLTEKNLKAKKHTSVAVKEQAGKTTTSEIENSFTYDKSDNILMPKNGYILSFAEGIAGLGGNRKYLRHTAKARYFKSFFNNQLTFKLGAEGGNIKGISGQKTFVDNRFSISEFEFRGFESSGIGPRTKKAKGDEKEFVGGKNYYLLKAEAEFPVGLPPEMEIKGVSFIDAGSVWGYDLAKKTTLTKKDIDDSRAMRVSAGLGIAWNTKLGPIRIYYGIPLKKQKFDVKQNFSFVFSSHF